MNNRRKCHFYYKGDGGSVFKNNHHRKRQYVAYCTAASLPNGFLPNRIYRRGEGYLTSLESCDVTGYSSLSTKIGKKGLSCLVIVPPFVSSNLYIPLLPRRAMQVPTSTTAAVDVAALTGPFLGHFPCVRIFPHIYIKKNGYDTLIFLQFFCL